MDTSTAVSTYQAIRVSQSHVLPIRGLSYHIRTWGDPSGTPLMLCHGWMDTSASFQFLVDSLTDDNWYIVAPDWRGFGLTDWDYGYSFNDYIADLDAVALHFFADQAFHLVGHSMGGNIAGTYAGVRTNKVLTLSSLEGFGWIDEQPKKAVRSLEKWLDEQITPPELSTYTDFAELESKLSRRYPLMPADRVAFMASHWGQWDDVSEKVILRADPKHKMSTPNLYRLDERIVVWQNISAPTLWLAGDDTKMSAVFASEEFLQRRQYIDNLQYEVVKKAGHMLHIEQAEICARLIETHITQNSSA